MTTRGRLDPCRDLFCKKHFSCARRRPNRPPQLPVLLLWWGQGKCGRQGSGQVQTTWWGLSTLLWLPLPTQSLPNTTRHTTICCCPNTLGWSLHILSPWWAPTHPSRPNSNALSTLSFCAPMALVFIGFNGNYLCALLPWRTWVPQGRLAQLRAETWHKAKGIEPRQNYIVSSFLLYLERLSWRQALCLTLLSGPQTTSMWPGKAGPQGCQNEVAPFGYITHLFSLQMTWLLFSVDTYPLGISSCARVCAEVLGWGG